MPRLSKRRLRSWPITAPKKLSGQFIMDTHTHFLRDDTRLTNFVRMREAVGKSSWE